MLASAVRRVSCIAGLVVGLTLVGSSAGAAAPDQTASALDAVVRAHAVTFVGQGKGATEADALAVAERDARRQAAENGLTDCVVVAAHVSLPFPSDLLWFADVVIECTPPDDERPSPTVHLS